MGTFIFVTAVLLVMAVPALSQRSDATTSRIIGDIWAVKIMVVDMYDAIEFYRDILGLDVMTREYYPETVPLKSTGVHIILEQCAQRSEWDYNRGCRFNLNLYVEDLPAYVIKLRRAGVRVLDDTLRTAGVGRYVRILDPSDNLLNIMQLGYEHESVSKPTVYNVGARISDMTKSRKFYEEVLGFEVLSDKYYPPVIPYKTRGIQLILHESGEGPSEAAYPDGSQTVLTLLTFDLEGAIDRLQAARVKLLSPEPTDGVAGRCIAVRDPDGNVIELLELEQGSPFPPFGDQ